MAGTAAGAPMPVAFMSHGAGPWPYAGMANTLGVSSAEKASMTASLQAQGQHLNQKPKALLVISAHWEEAVPTVMTSAAPPMLFDYYGFPEETYKLSWPAPGSPELGKRVQELLGSAGFDTATDAERGYDHGTFVPLMLAFPKADIPTTQLSLRANLDPKEHMAIGRALQPLRNEGVYIIASGMTYHNLNKFRSGGGEQDAQIFNQWLVEAVSNKSVSDRAQSLEQWEVAPQAKASHPTEEHLLPLMVAVGAAGDDTGVIAFDGPHMGVRCLSFMFG